MAINNNNSISNKKTITVFIGSDKHIDLKDFFSKYPENQWNSIARDMLKALVYHHGTDWNPLIEGYDFYSPIKKEEMAIAPTNIIVKQSDEHIVNDNIITKENIKENIVKEDNYGSSMIHRKDISSSLAIPTRVKFKN